MWIGKKGPFTCAASLGETMGVVFLETTTNRRPTDLESLQILTEIEENGGLNGNPTWEYAPNARGFDGWVLDMFEEPWCLYSRNVRRLK